MIDKAHYESLLPTELYQQIADLYDSVKKIQSEATGIMSVQKPDSTAQLHDVLQSTEDATNTILDSATAINELAADCKTEDAKNQIGEKVQLIYEACSFQDLTGQRIKKVLKNLTILEEKIAKISEAAKAHITTDETEEAAPVNTEASLMNGPALTKDAPTQADIDKLFSSL